MARNWVNGGPPALNATNLNALEADVTAKLNVTDAQTTYVAKVDAISLPGTAPTSTGQVLSNTSTTSPYGLAWITPSSGGTATTTVTTVSAAGAAQTLVIGHDKLTLTAASCALTMPTASAGVTNTVTVELKQDSTGSRVVTWPASVIWPGGAAPTLTTAANRTDVLRVTSSDAGATWLGQTIALNYPTTGSADVTPPTAPSNLAAGTVTSTTIPLTWTASTDAVGVTGYNAYNNGTLLQAGLTGTSGTLTGLTASTAYVLTLKAYDAAGNLSTASNTVNVSTSAGAAVAPSDNFNRADTVQTATSPLGTTSTGAATWIYGGNTNGKFYISSNTVKSSDFAASNNGATDINVAAVECSAANGTVSVTCVTASTASGGGGGIGPACRYVDGNNYIMAAPDSVNGNVSIYKVLAGVLTFVSSPTGTVTATSTIALVANGTSFQVKVDGVNFGSPATISDAVYTGVTKHGIACFRPAATADNWSFA